MDSKTIKYNEALDLLANAVNDFKIEEAHKDLPYVVASDFVRYLSHCYQTESFDKLQHALIFIEKLYVYGDNQTQELATNEFFEGLQNVWRNNQYQQRVVGNKMLKNKNS